MGFNIQAAINNAMMIEAEELAKAKAHDRAFNPVRLQAAQSLLSITQGKSFKALHLTKSQPAEAA